MKIIGRDRFINLYILEASSLTPRQRLFKPVLAARFRNRRRVFPAKARAAEVLVTGETEKPPDRKIAEGIRADHAAAGTGCPA